MNKILILTIAALALMIALATASTPGIISNIYNSTFINTTLNGTIIYGINGTNGINGTDGSTGPQGIPGINGTDILYYNSFSIYNINNLIYTKNLSSGDFITLSTINESINYAHDNIVKTYPGKITISGIYTIDNTISLNLASNLVLDFTNAKFILNNTKDINIFVLNNSNNIRIIGGEYDGNRYNQSTDISSAFRFYGGNNIYISDMNIYNVSRFGIYADNFNNINIKNIDINDIGTLPWPLEGRGIYLNSGSNAHVLNVNGTNFSRYGIMYNVISKGTISDSTISKAYGDRGIYVSTSDGVVISNVHSSFNNFAGITMADSSDGDVISSVSENNTLDGLLIQADNNTATNKSNNIRIIGGSYKNNIGDGITIQSLNASWANATTVLGTSVDNNTIGINLNGAGVQNTIVIGNTVKNHKRIGSRGIRVSTARGSTIFGNDLGDNNDNALLLSSDVRTSAHDNRGVGGYNWGNKASAPSSLVRLGDTYYNTTDLTLNLYNGTSWFRFNGTNGIDGVDGINGTNGINQSDPTKLNLTGTSDIGMSGDINFTIPQDAEDSSYLGVRGITADCGSFVSGLWYYYGNPDDYLHNAFTKYYNSCVGDMSINSYVDNDLKMRIDDSIYAYTQIDINQNKIINLSNASNFYDAVNKGYVDTKVNKNGDIMTGILVINNSIAPLFLNGICCETHLKINSDSQNVGMEYQESYNPRWFMGMFPSVGGSNIDYNIYNYYTGSSPLKIDGNNNTVFTPFIASSAQSNALCYNSGTGEITFNNGLTTCLASTESSKTNITNITIPMNSSLMKIKPITYTSKDNNLNYGFLAQQLSSTYPELIGYETLYDTISVFNKTTNLTDKIKVNPHKGNVTGVKYENMVAILVKVIQEQQTTLNKICSKQPDLCI